MGVRKTVGRPPKVNYKIMLKLADAIQHNANITDACRYAGITRQTYYDYLKNEEVFAEKMVWAKENQDKLVMNFLTIW